MASDSTKQVIYLTDLSGDAFGPYNALPILLPYKAGDAVASTSGDRVAVDSEADEGTMHVDLFPALFENNDVL